MKPEKNSLIISPEEHMKTVVRGKEEYQAYKQKMSFEEKLKILVKLQEKAYFFGKTRVKPWPIH